MKKKERNNKSADNKPIHKNNSKVKNEIEGKRENKSHNKSIRKKKPKINNNIEKLRYYKNIKDNILFKYSLSKIYEAKNTIYYICSDTHYEGRLKVQYDFDIDKSKDEYKIKLVKQTKKHSLKTEEHNYKINQIIKTDLKEKS